MKEDQVALAALREREHVPFRLFVDVERVDLAVPSRAPQHLPDAHRLVADGIAPMGRGKPLVYSRHRLVLRSSNGKNAGRRKEARTQRKPSTREIWG
jgi:hypothetical protein